MCMSSYNSGLQKLRLDHFSEFLTNIKFRNDQLKSISTPKEILNIQDVERKACQGILHSNLQFIYDNQLAGKLFPINQPSTDNIYNYFYVVSQMSNLSQQVVNQKLSKIPQQTFQSLINDQNILSRDHIELKAYINSLLPFSIIQIPAQQQNLNGLYDNQYNQYDLYGRYQPLYYQQVSNLNILEGTDWLNILQNVQYRIAVIKYYGLWGLIKDNINTKVYKIEQQQGNYDLQIDKFNNLQDVDVVLSIQTSRTFTFHARYINIINSSISYGINAINITLNYPKILVSASLDNIKLTNLAACKNLRNLYSNIPNLQTQFEYYSGLTELHSIQRLHITYKDNIPFINILNKMKFKTLLYLNITDNCNNMANNIAINNPGAFLKLAFFRYVFPQLNNYQLRIHVSTVLHPYLLALFLKRVQDDYIARNTQKDIYSKTEAESRHLRDSGKDKVKTIASKIHIGASKAVSAEFSSIQLLMDTFRPITRHRTSESFLKSVPSLNRVQFGSMKSLEEYLGQNLFYRLHTLFTITGNFLIGPPTLLHFVLDLFQVKWKERELHFTAQRKVNQSESRSEEFVMVKPLIIRPKQVQAEAGNAENPQINKDKSKITIKTAHSTYEKLFSYLKDFGQDHMYQKALPDEPNVTFFDKKWVTSTTEILKKYLTCRRIKGNIRQKTIIQIYKECQQLQGIVGRQNMQFQYDFPTRYICFLMLSHLNQIPKRRFILRFNIRTNDQASLLKPFNKQHMIMDDYQLNVLSNMVKYLPRSDVMLQFSQHKAQKYPQRHKQQYAINTNQYKITDCNKKYLNNLFSNIESRLQIVQSNDRFVMVKLLQRNEIHIETLSKDRKDNQIAELFFKKLPDNDKYYVIINTFYPPQQLQSMKIRHLTFVNTNNRFFHKNNPQKLLSSNLQLEYPQYLISLTIQNVNITNFNQCTHLQVLYSQQNIFTSRKIQNLNQLKKIFSNQDQYDDPMCMIPTLLKQNSLEYIETYSGTNIIQKDIQLKTNLQNLQMIYCTDNKFESAQINNSSYTNPLNIRICIQQFYSDELRCLRDTYISMVRNGTYTGQVEIKRRRVTISNKKEVAEYLGNTKYLQLLHVLQNQEEYFDGTDEAVYFAKKVILGGVDIYVPEKYKFRTRFSQHSKVIAYLKNYRECTKNDRAYYDNTGGLLDIKALEDIYRQAPKFSQNDERQLRRWFSSQIYGSHTGSDIFSLYSTACFASSVLTMPVKIFATKYTKAAPSSHKVAQPVEIHKGGLPEVQLESRQGHRLNGRFVATKQDGPVEFHRRGAKAKISAAALTQTDSHIVTPEIQPKKPKRSYIRSVSQQSKAVDLEAHLRALVKVARSPKISSLKNFVAALTTSEELQACHLVIAPDDGLSLLTAPVAQIRQLFNLLRHRIVDFEAPGAVLLRSKVGNEIFRSAALKNVDKLFTLSVAKLANGDKNTIFDAIVTDRTCKWLEKLRMESLIYKVGGQQPVKLNLCEPEMLRSVTLCKVRIFNLNSCKSLENLCSAENNYDMDDIKDLKTLKRFHSTNDEYSDYDTPMLVQLFATNDRIQYVYVKGGDMVAAGALLRANIQKLVFFYAELSDLDKLPIISLSNDEKPAQLQFLQVDVVGRAGRRTIASADILDGTPQSKNSVIKQLVTTLTK